jgi:sugar O-acyltransferase (sialic acid O-acetyltransferase NeuD family)
MNNSKVLLWGGKLKSKIIEEMILESNISNDIVTFDSTISELGYTSKSRFISDILELQEVIHSLKYFIVCIGGENGYARYKTSIHLKSLGLTPINIIHEKSFVEKTSSIGEGCQVMPCAVLHKFSSVGNYSILNTNSTVDHDCSIGNGVHIMGGASVAGGVQILDYATIGTNATILPHITIGEGAFVGAGAVVTKDVQENSVVMGSPAHHYKIIDPIFMDEDLKQLKEYILSKAL